MGTRGHEGAAAVPHLCLCIPQRIQVERELVVARQGGAVARAQGAAEAGACRLSFAVGRYNTTLAVGVSLQKRVYQGHGRAYDFVSELSMSQGFAEMKLKGRFKRNEEGFGWPKR